MTTQTTPTYRITRLVETNFKRISSLDISPGTRTLVILQGPNEAGKTSGLEGLIAALGGKRKAPEVPVRTGADDAIIELTIGSESGPAYHIARSFKGDRTCLSVYSVDAEGNRSKISAGQTHLDALVSDITFDPLAFSKADRPLQVRMLCNAIGQPELLDKAKSRKDAILESRRQVNTKIDGLQARLNSPELADPAPGQVLHEVTQDGVRARLEQVEAKNKARRDAAATIADFDQKIAAARSTIAEMEQKLAQWREHETKLTMARGERQAALDAMPAETPTADLAAQLAQIDVDNAKVRQQKARLQAIADRDLLQKQAAVYNGQLSEIDAGVETAIGASDLGKAVPGLAFKDGELLHNSLPWSQASGMRKLELSTLIGMAANPQLRIMTIDEADRLDDASLQRLKQLANERNFQLWMTGVRLGDETDEDTYIAKIVDGRSVGTSSPSNGRAGSVAAADPTKSPAAAGKPKPIAAPVASFALDDIDL